MYTKLVSSLLAASAMTAQAGVMRRGDTDTTPTWQATDFVWGSSPGGTSGTYTLTAEDDYHPGAPGFQVACSPIMVQRGWTPCQTPDGDELPSTSRVEVIWTSGDVLGRFYLGAAHIYQAEDGTWVNATAGTDFETPEPRTSTDFEFPVHTIEELDEEPPAPEV